VLLVFEPNGKYRETIGRKGQGPGEYTAISQVFVLPGDSIRLDDTRNGRYTILSPEYRVVRTSPYPIAHYLSTILFPDGFAVTTKTLRTPQEVGLPLHRVNPAGEIVRSFGADTPIYRTGMSNVFKRFLAPSSAPGQFHAAQFQAYVVERWDTAGRKVGEIVRDADWFRPWTTQPKLTPDAPARNPVLFAIREDRQGRLWTFSEVPQADWKKHVHQSPYREGEPTNWFIGGVTRNDGADTMVEVIDLASGQLLVSQRFDQMLWKMFEDGFVYSDGEDDVGNSYVDIWRIVLKQP
jgi:hypothetical protein